MLVDVVCGHCGAVYQKEQKYVNVNVRFGHKNYCSAECQGQAKSKATVANYVNCGKEVTKKAYEYKRSKSGNIFCSRSCAISYNNSVCKSYANHPNFVDGISTYRRRALEHYGPHCTVCRYDIVETLEVHHRNGNRQDNRIENLDVLCPTHHKEYEFGIRSYNT